MSSHWVVFISIWDHQEDFVKWFFLRDFCSENEILAFFFGERTRWRIYEDPHFDSFYPASLEKLRLWPFVPAILANEEGTKCLALSTSFAYSALRKINSADAKSVKIQKQTGGMLRWRRHSILYLAWIGHDFRCHSVFLNDKKVPDKWSWWDQWELPGVLLCIEFINNSDMAAGERLNCCGGSKWKLQGLKTSKKKLNNKTTKTHTQNKKAQADDLHKIELRDPKLFS